MINYFNSLSFREKLIQLQKCKLFSKKELKNSTDYLKEKKIVIIGCGAQGLNQGLNMRDSGLNIKFALKAKTIQNQTISWKRAIENHFSVGTYDELIPTADLVINLTPDKQHSKVVKEVQKLMKKKSVLGYSHGFNIIEQGEKIRKDITVIMVAPKSPGTEVRKEFEKGFGVPTLIAVHGENDLYDKGLKFAKSWAVSLGGDKAGVLLTSFSAEVKSDLMGEQTILCGMLQTSSDLLFKYLIKKGFDKLYATKLIQFGWKIITKPLKQGGIALMLDQLSDNSKLRVLELSKNLKNIFSSLYRKHMDDIISGLFSKKMIKDWKRNDKNLLKWREKYSEIDFEKSAILSDFKGITEKEFFENGILMIAIVKAGVELAFEIMVETGMSSVSAYYESLHELPLIANTIARKKLYEMNLVISDTAEYGSYLFSKSALPILEKFLQTIKKTDIGINIEDKDINNISLLQVNKIIQNHPIEKIGKKLRKYMNSMKKFAF